MGYAYRKELIWKKCVLRIALGILLSYKASPHQ